jgi:hypothetical protein
MIKRRILAAWAVGALLGGVLLAGCATQQAEVFQPLDVGAATPWTKSEFKADPDEFQFAVVSDRHGGSRPGVFKSAIEKLNLLQPEFVMSVGDLISGGTEELATLDAEYNAMDGLLAGLEMRFFRVAGNHDISNPVMLGAYKKRYGLPYYHFLYKEVLFLVICTEDRVEKSNISRDQVAYIKKALSENKDSRWTFVFMHKPLFAPKDGKQDKQWSEIEEVLKDRPHTVMAGHWHSYGKRVKHGQSYIRLATTGGGSGLKGIEHGQFDHVVWITMTSRGPRIANLMLDGIHSEDVRLDE